VHEKRPDHSIRPLRFSAHVRDKGGARWNAPANSGVSLGALIITAVQKYVHPTQDHQQTEMDRIDKIRHESKRQYLELLRSQAHGRPTATGISGDFDGLDGKGRETVQ
jgi:hypothetical protein